MREGVKSNQESKESLPKPHINFHGWNLVCFQRSQQFLIAVAPSPIAVILVLSKLLLLYFSPLYPSFHSDHFSVSTWTTRLNQASLLLNLLLVSVLAKEWVDREMKDGCVGYISSLFKEHNNFYASPGMRRNQQRFSCLQWCYISVISSFRGRCQCHLSSLEEQLSVQSTLLQRERQFGKDILEPDL